MTEPFRVEVTGSNRGNEAVLWSDWTGLSPHLIASFYPVERISDGQRGERWARDPTEPEVRAPITDGRLEATQNWHSPFENMDLGQQFSSISALLQTGAAAQTMMLVQDFVDKLGIAPLTAATQWATSKTKGFEGRSSITKLNSRQVFMGMPPAKLTLTAHFRALKDARVEVEDPLNQLMRWALPQELAPDGPLQQFLRTGDFSLFPSRIPRIIGMSYANMQLLPLVIEFIPYPMTGPRDRNGAMLSAAVEMQLSTLTAIDTNDWNGVRRV